MIHWAVLELEGKLSEDLRPFYCEDYSIKEIAALLHIPKTAKTNLKRGREQVKNYWGLSEHKRSQ